jgi:hypothetical protein
MTGAVQEALNGKPVDWMEKVSDETIPKKLRGTEKGKLRSSVER